MPVYAVCITSCQARIAENCIFYVGTLNECWSLFYGPFVLCCKNPETKLCVNAVENTVICL